MMRSMFSGVSGLRSHQTMMDVVGNNIANVNTAGFKASQVTFAETISQVIRGAAGATEVRGGTNPIQIGLGVKLASIDTVYTQGASQVTGRNTDLAVQGEGFFLLQNGDERFYTRAGAFSFDENGNLASPGGMLVQGWMAGPNGINPNDPVTAITLPVGQVIDPRPTSVVDFGGNLSAAADVGTVRSSSITVYDSIGAGHEVQLDFTKTGTNQWSASASVGGVVYSLTPSTLTFDSAGQLSSPTPLRFSGFTPPGATPLAFDVDLAGANPVVQFGGVNSAEAFGQDGEAIGYLRNFAIADDGSIVGQFSNGLTKVLAKVATATFNNPSGLLGVGDSNFVASTGSGEALVGEPGSGNRGFLSAGTLEMSNVELAREFTNLIVAQRGFQANSRIITASDEMLAELVNLKR